MVTYMIIYFRVYGRVYDHIFPSVYDHISPTYGLKYMIIYSDHILEIYAQLYDHIFLEYMVHRPYNVVHPVYGLKTIYVALSIHTGQVRNRCGIAEWLQNQWIPMPFLYIRARSGTCAASRNGSRTNGFLCLFLTYRLCIHTITKFLYAKPNN